MIDDLRIKNAILEEKLLFKMKQATYYKKKYQEAQNIIKEAREHADEWNYNWYATGSEEDHQRLYELLEILDKEIKK